MGKVIKVIDLFNMIERKEVKDKQKLRVTFENNLTRDIYYDASERLSICSLKNCSDDYDFADEYNLDDKVEILDEEDKIDIQSIEEIISFRKSDDELYNDNFSDFKFSINELIQAVKQLDNKLKEK